MNVGLIIISIIIGIGAGIGIFMTMVDFINRIAKSFPSRKNTNSNIYKWWNESIDLNPIDFLNRNIRQVIEKFKKGYKDSTAILFYSFCFTILAALIGGCISIPVKALALYFNFPNDLSIGQERYNVFFERTNLGIIYQFLFWLSHCIILYVTIRTWKKYKSFNVVYALLLYWVLSVFTVKSISIWADYIFREDYPLDDFSFLATTILNLSIFLFLFKYIQRTTTLQSFVINLFLIILINFFTWSINDNFKWLFKICFVDGLINHLVIYILPCYVIHLIGIRFLYILIRKESNSSIIFILKMGLILFLIGCLFFFINFILHTTYMFTLLRNVPEMSLYPFSPDFTYIHFVKSCIMSEIRLGDYYSNFIYLSAFVPLSLYISLIIVHFLLIKFRKKTASFVFYLYVICSNNQRLEAGIIPWYIMVVFIAIISAWASGLTLYYSLS